MARSAKTRPTRVKRLSRKSGVGDVLQRYVAGIDRTLKRLEPDARALDEPTVHHFRTAIRRGRSLLSAFKAGIPAAKRKELSHRLKDQSQRYAGLREWDVLIHALTKTANASDRRRLADVAEAAKQRRAAEALNHRSLRADIRAIDRAMVSAPWLRAPKPREAPYWNQAVGDIAPALLDRQAHKLRRWSRKLDLADTASFHRFRIAAKKHRYTVELLTPVYGKKRVKPYLERLIAIQDVLGEMRDALRAQELVATLRLQPASRLLVTRWLERRVAACRARFPAHNKAFRRETPFWER